MPLIRPCVSFSYELGKTARNVISRSSPSDAPRLLVSRLVVPSRRASRSLFIIMVFARGEIVSCCSAHTMSHRSRSCLVLFCLVGAERHAFVLRRGGVLVLILRLSSRSLLVVSSRGTSRCLSLMFCGLRRRGVLARLVSGYSSRVVGRGVVPVSPFRLVARLVAWGGFSRLITAGVDGRRFPSCRLGVDACLPRCRRGRRCRSRHRCSRLLLVIIWLRGI